MLSFVFNVHFKYKIQKKIFHHGLLQAIELKHTKKEYKSYNMMGIFVYKSIDFFEIKTLDIQTSELDSLAIGFLYSTIATSKKRQI